SVDDWNDTITGDADSGYGTDAECVFPSPAADTGNGLTGASLTSITFNPSSGTFSTEFALEREDVLIAGLSEGHNVSYSVSQNARYVGTDGQHGATTSADVFSNDVEIRATTTAIEAVANLTNGSNVSAGDIEQAW